MNSTDPEDAHGILTMHHDQGQIAMKPMGFHGGVSFAGGSPIPVGAPAHGTAFGLAARPTRRRGPGARGTRLGRYPRPVIL
ncbi:4-hydroxythreonine-4-phosphate dehydrogenase PdxA [Streptomyces sp. NPDC058257]|uniref:4-hydroxythreonine-4-phosphate dehydrogenase PdxA n=1 Tax=Streptomyces sp. NPDC058257 TaxID=3346409 RepID=UPI0036E9D6C6